MVRAMWPKINSAAIPSAAAILPCVCTATLDQIGRCYVKECELHEQAWSNAFGLSDDR